MASAAVIRPLRDADVAAAEDCAARAFADLHRRGLTGPMPARDDAEIASARARVEHCLAGDPGGAWVAESPEGIVGVALAIVRDAIWGLSLLVVDPASQSTGLGRGLLARALGHGAEEVRGWIILASEDPRALRAYARAGFALEPTFEAEGVPDLAAVEAPADVREGDERDLALVDEIDGVLRGGSHRRDVPVMLSRPGARLLVLPGRGYAVTRPGALVLLAARSDEDAAALLRAALHAAAAPAGVAVPFVTARQAWAVPVLLDAGLALHTEGALCVKGDLGRLAPYIPSGAYL